MTAPEITRAKPPLIADERTMLETWLDYHRATLLQKCAGLDDEQLRRRACPPSTLSLLGLVRHMADVELGWFVNGFVDPDLPPLYSSPEDPDGDFDVADADVDADFATYDTAVARARDAVRGVSLEATSTDRGGHTFSLRWIFVHMIEEYARHNGHADLIREAIDGATGQ